MYHKKELIWVWPAVVEVYIFFAGRLFALAIVRFSSFMSLLPPPSCTEIFAFEALQKYLRRLYCKYRYITRFWKLTAISKMHEGLQFKTLHAGTANYSAHESACLHLFKTANDFQFLVMVEPSAVEHTNINTYHGQSAENAVLYRLYFESLLFVLRSDLHNSFNQLGGNCRSKASLNEFVLAGEWIFNVLKPNAFKKRVNASSSSTWSLQPLGLATMVAVSSFCGCSRSIVPGLSEDFIASVCSGGRNMSSVGFLFKRTNTQLLHRKNKWRMHERLPFSASEYFLRHHLQSSQEAFLRRLFHEPSCAVSALLAAANQMERMARRFLQVPSTAGFCKNYICQRAWSS